MSERLILGDRREAKTLAAYLVRYLEREMAVAAEIREKMPTPTGASYQRGLETAFLATRGWLVGYLGEDELEEGRRYVADVDPRYSEEGDAQ